MAFLQRLQDAEEENEELRHQLQQLRSEEGDKSGFQLADEAEAGAAIQELKRQQHELNVKLDVERLRYQNAVEQLKHAEAQGKAKSAEISSLQEQLLALERHSSKRLEEAINALAELEAKTASLCKVPVQEADASLREAHDRIHELQKVIESLRIKEEEGKRRERLMEQRNMSLETRLRKGGVPALEEPVVRVEMQQPQEQQQQQRSREQQQLSRMQELVIEFQQQLQQHQHREQQFQAQLQEANVNLLVARQEHQQECLAFQKQIFAAEDVARSSSFATSQAQGVLEQSRDRVRTLEADVKRLESTVHEQQQHIQKQQQQARLKVFQTVAVQTVYSSPVVSDGDNPAMKAPLMSLSAADVPEQVVDAYRLRSVQHI